LHIDRGGIAGVRDRGATVIREGVSGARATNFEVLDDNVFRQQVRWRIRATDLHNSAVFAPIVQARSCNGVDTLDYRQLSIRSRHIRKSDWLRGSSLPAYHPFLLIRRCAVVDAYRVARLQRRKWSCSDRRVWLARSDLVGSGLSEAGEHQAGEYRFHDRSLA